MTSFNNHQFNELSFHIAEAKRHLKAIETIMAEAKVNGANLFCDETAMYPSRAMSKSELAAMQRMSTKQFVAWLKPLRPQLRAMGVSDRARLLKPEVVHFICKQLHITLDEKRPC